MLPKAVMNVAMFTWDNNDFAEDQNYTLRDVVEVLGYDLGLDDYPIFDEAYRGKLNKAITDHFWFRRIASETPSAFVFYLNRKMREQMPNVNPVYVKVREDGFDPIATSQRMDSGQSKGSNASTTDTTGSGTGRNISSNTPQVFLDDPEDPKYMNALGQTTSSSTGTDKSSGTNDSSYSGNSSAVDGGYASAVYDMMSAGFMATDTLVFSILEPLFMQFHDDQPK